MIVGRTSPRIWGCFFLVFAFSTLWGEGAPQLVRVSGLPEGQQQYWCAEPLPGGWAAGTSEGVVVQEKAGWKLVRPPTPGYVRTLTHYAHGLVVTGEGFFYLYAQGRWIPKKTDDFFRAGVSVSGSAILVGRHSVCVVNPEGELVTARQYSGESNIKLHQVGQRVYVLPAKEQPLKWESSTLQDATAELPWIKQVGGIASLQKLESGELLAATGTGLFLVNGNNVTPLLESLRNVFASEGLIGAYIFGRTVTVLTFGGGVRIFSRDDERLLWTEPVATSGSIYFSKPTAEGILIGTSTGLYVLSDPSRFRYVKFPVADFIFSGLSKYGPVVGLANGVVGLNGARVNAPSPVVSSLVLKDGRQIWGGVGTLTIDEHDMAVSGGDVIGLAELERRVAVLQSQVLWFFDPDGTREPLLSIPLASIPNSIARTSSGGCLVGTAEGVLPFTKDGNSAPRWGSGMMRVKACHGVCFAMDTHGGIFTEMGERWATLPSSEIIDVEDWNGSTWILARFPDQTIWLGRWDNSEKTWVPYDAPVGRSARALVGAEDSLFVVRSEGTLEISHPAPLRIPECEVVVGGDYEVPVPTSPHLESENDALTLLFPAPRLGPWANPSYAVQVDRGGWEAPAVVAQTRLIRLPRGRSTIQIKASWAGIEKETTVSVTRDRPWWARWPAWAVYVALATGAIYRVIGWRTHQLRKRAEMLEKQVEERTAELKKAQKAREDFFSTISHEIRNPLNGVVGICDILGHSEEDDPRRTRRHVKTLRGCADQLRTILDDVLDFSRIDRGDIQIYDEVFEIGSAIDGAVRSVDPDLEKTSLKVPSREVWVHGDQGKIRQIVTNLVSNALKYGVPSAAQVFLEVDEQPGGPVSIGILVKNTGNTLTKEEIERIFAEFVRGDDALRRKIPGSGLGLAVSKRMAEAMKGNLTASSANGLTEFKLSLQLQHGEPVEENAPEVGEPFERSRALAIEDEEYNRTVLGFHLAQLGYQVDWAKDGASALQWARETGYDLILTDFMLPDMMGDELARELLKMVPHPKPPIIAVTAYSTPDKIAQAKAAGITGFVTKPVSKKKLQAAILGATANLEVRPPTKQDPTLKCDFTVFTRMNDGRRLLAEFAEGLATDWETIAKECGSEPGDRHLVVAIHTFKSRVLVAHAGEMAEQLGLLEDAVQERRPADVLRLLAVIRPMVAELALRAREEAFV